jgi:hypothetical protein
MLPALGLSRSRWIPFACIAASVALIGAPTTLEAQYSVAPMPAMSTSSLTRDPHFNGYISVRETIRDDTMTFILHRARLTVAAMPAPFVALKVQADFATVGRTTGSSGDTIPGLLITDAFIQLVPPDTASRITRMLRPALLIGQFKAPFSLEYLTSSTSLLTANRAFPADRLGVKRDRGFAAQVRFPRFVTLSGALVDGEGTNRTSNPDGKEMAVGRLTLLPVPMLSVSGKWSGHGADHRWGYDARWVGGDAVLEGEVVEREGPTNATTNIDARAEYALAGYQVLSWLQPVVKWERLNETLTTATTSARTRITLTTIGANLVAPGERFRAQINWIDPSQRGVDRKGEFILQLQASY